MKKVLLLSSVIASGLASAQTLTVNDTLSSGMSTTYYVLDSNAVSLDAVVGTGVTWDYSSILGYDPGMTNADNVTLASTSTYASDFPSSDYNDNLATGASLYFTNNADSMTVQGFVFNVDTYTVKVLHSANPMIALKFPMAVGTTYNDPTQGTVDVGVATGTTTGNAVVTCDGFGTLNVGLNSHPNVLRIKLVENINTSITIPPFPTSTGTVTRTLYSYYDLANDKQAIFVHATIDVVTDIVTDNYTAVYYSSLPSFSGVAQNANIPFSIFPNPAASQITLQSDGNADAYQIINSLGEVVLTSTKPQTTEVMDISSLATGVYIIQIRKGDLISNQKLVIE